MEYNPLPKTVASTKKAQQLLQQRLSYTLHKPRRRHFPTLPTLVFGVDEQWQIDLADLKSLAKWNKGYQYLITVIDVLSKFAWAEPIKSKGGEQVKRVKTNMEMRLSTTTITGTVRSRKRIL